MLFANFTALPIKFLKPYIISGDLLISTLLLSFSEVNCIFFSVFEENETIISLNNPSKVVALKNLSSVISFFEICFKISLHLLVWLIKRSKSFLYFESSPISFLSSLATTEIVASGVPREWAAAAACPPNDSSSYSFAITCCSLDPASNLFFVSLFLLLVRSKASS